MISWLRLIYLEYKPGNTFGKYDKYNFLCLDRKASTAAEKLSIAREVYSGPNVGIMESCVYHCYLKRHGHGLRSR